MGGCKSPKGQPHKDYKTLLDLFGYTNMNIKIYAIGGELNDQYVGTATDVQTGLSLLDYIKSRKGYACSLHGKGLFHYAPDVIVSGEFLMSDAYGAFNLIKNSDKVENCAIPF
jgi:hypothetical protein